LLCKLRPFASERPNSPPLANRKCQEFARPNPDHSSGGLIFQVFAARWVWQANEALRWPWPGSKIVRIWFARTSDSPQPRRDLMGEWPFLPAEASFDIPSHGVPDKRIRKKVRNWVAGNIRDGSWKAFAGIGWP